MRLVSELTLEKFRHGPCEHCGKVGRTDPHHVYAKGNECRLDIRENLVALCRRCHTEHHSGHSPTRRELLAIVARREGTTPEAIQAKIWRLRRAEKVVGAVKSKRRRSRWPTRVIQSRSFAPYIRKRDRMKLTKGV